MSDAQLVDLISEEQRKFLTPEYMRKTGVVPLGRNLNERLVFGTRDELDQYQKDTLLIILEEPINFEKLGPEQFQNCLDTYLKKYYPEELIPKPIQKEIPFD
jgi:hypothetical protein